MSPGSSTESYPAFPRIGLREKPGKNLNQDQDDGVENGGKTPYEQFLHIDHLDNNILQQIAVAHQSKAPCFLGTTIRNRKQLRCDEQETLPHVLGFCHHGELLRISRHNTVRSLIASSIHQNASYEVYEEVGCVSSDGSTRRADIIIIDRQKDKGVILDPTIRFEMHEQQPQESLMLAGNEFQSLGRAIVKEDEYEEVRWDGNVSIVSWQERVFRLWWEESLSQPIASRDGLANRDKSIHVCDLMTSYDINIHSQHHPPSLHSLETFSWLEHSSYPAFAHIGLRKTPEKSSISNTNSITATQRAYQREFGVRNPPKRDTILGLVNKLETTGSLMSEKGKHRSSRLPTVVVELCDDRIISRNLWPPRSPDLTTPDNICYRATQRAHQREFGVRNPPKRNTILGLVNKLETTGSLVSEKGKHRSSRLPRLLLTNLWPPRSPDLTTPAFFLWGYLKDRVYATRPQTLDDLKHITQEIQAIDNRVLQRVASNMERRVKLYYAGWRTFSTFAIELRDYNVFIMCAYDSSAILVNLTNSTFPPVTFMGASEGTKNNTFTVSSI
ncbi:hypothetical protein ANN_09047 [Periplaneta americana]|uniref:DUF4817 domain-containing protein n=1 Tax=Periplaneta americana TaxID=6978 RepID=A0ABQ8TKA7_PERAM|nr:hypothetical protein ANN_09047 [Periplaneta americana]